MKNIHHHIKRVADGTDMPMRPQVASGSFMASPMPMTVCIHELYRTAHVSTQLWDISDDFWEVQANMERLVNSIVSDITDGKG